MKMEDSRGSIPGVYNYNNRNTMIKPYLNGIFEKSDKQIQTIMSRHRLNPQIKNYNSHRAPDSNYNSFRVTNSLNKSRQLKVGEMTTYLTN